MSRLYPERLNRDFNATSENERIFEAYMKVLNPPLSEDATEDAKKTLDAILGALKDDGGDMS
jgi:flagellar biosynthesis regulator FlbT